MSRNIVFIPPCMRVMGESHGNKAPMDNSIHQLEMMYPKVYFIIYPVVKHHCDMMERKHGAMHMPDRREIEEMIENIYDEIEDDVKEYIHDNEDDSETCVDMTRQWGYRRRMFGDLLGIMLVGEMINRRRRPYYPPYYGGYPYPVY